jgi:hypothetical protein
LLEGCCVGVYERQQVVHGVVHDEYQLSDCDVERLELTLPVSHLADHRAQSRALQQDRVRPLHEVCCVNTLYSETLQSSITLKILKQSANYKSEGQCTQVTFPNIRLSERDDELWNTTQEVKTHNITGPRPKEEEEEDKLTFYNEHTKYAFFFVMCDMSNAKSEILERSMQNFFRH